VSAPIDTPTGRVHIAFPPLDDVYPSSFTILDPDPTWTSLDQDYPSLVTSYTIDRGRQYELDRTDTGRATVEIADVDGVLDPTNSFGPYYGRLEPLLQILLARYDPVADEWFTRYRGFIQDFDYAFDPSQQVNRLTLSLVDLFEVLSSIEMQIGFDDPDDPGSGPAWGHVPTSAIVNEVGRQIWYRPDNVDDRMRAALGDARIPVEMSVIFSGNVSLWGQTYSPGESAMTVLQEAADAEFPGVSNIFCDRHGRLVFHGRLAKFDPVGVASGASPGSWTFQTWAVGDGAAVELSPTTTAHIRTFAFNRGLAQVINLATATPVGVNPNGRIPTEAELIGQTTRDEDSIHRFGFRTWASENLLTRTSLLDSSGALVETKRFADYYVRNYALPRDRITEISFRSLRPDALGAGANWRLLSKIDIADAVNVTVGSPGGGGFNAEPYFVEGIHEQVQPLGTLYDDVTMTLDLSPRVYFTEDPWEGIS